MSKMPITELPVGIGNDPEEIARTLMLYACLERGNQLATPPELPEQPDVAATESYLYPVREALDVWQKGLSVNCNRDASDSGFVQSNAIGSMTLQIRKAVEKLGVRVGSDFKDAASSFSAEKLWKEEIRFLTAGIEVLKTAQKIAKEERIATTLAALYADRGLSHKMSGDTIAIYDQAVADLEESVTLLPDNQQVNHWLADTYNSRGCKKSGASAIADFTIAIRLEDEKGLYYANRGIEHLGEKNFDKAIEDLMAACQRDDDPRYRERLAKAVNGKGLAILDKYKHAVGSPSRRELEEAENLFLEAAKIDPTNDLYMKNCDVVRRRRLGY